MKTRRLNSRHHLKAGAAALALVSVVSGVANGQEADAASTAPADKGDETVRYDTVVVQARKRDETIEDVPSSVTVLSSGALQDLLLDNAEELVRQVPGAILVSSGPDYLDDIALRGQGSGRLGFAETTTGIYRDGIFIAGGGFGGRTFSKIDFLDAENIQVYRGPQGALYGRNAVGGAVNVITAKPRDEFEARAKIGYNSVEEYSAEGMVNIPVGDKVALRFAGYYADQQDGFISDASTGRVLDPAEDWGVRGIIGVDVSADTRVNLTVESSHSLGSGFADEGQNIVIDTQPFKRIGISTNEEVNIDQTSVFAELTHDFGGVELTVLGNYKQRDGERTESDLDHFLGFNSPLLELIEEQREDFERQGLEVRLASADNSRITWLVGADYNAYTSEIVTPRTGTLLGPYAASAALRGQLRTDYANEDLTSYSIFGLVGVDLTDKLNLTVEGRVQVDQKDFNFERVDGDPQTDQTIPLTYFSEEWTRFLPAVSLKYALTDDTTLYAKVATGYRPGGFNQNPTPGFFDQLPYDPEDLYSIEAGWKANYLLGDMRVMPQLSVYYSVTDDLQQTTSLSQTNTTFTLQNVGGDYVYGAEFELNVIKPIGKGRWVNTFGLATTQGMFDDGTSILFQGATVDLSENRVPRTRDYMVNLTSRLSQPLTDKLSAFGVFSVQAEGGGYDNATNDRGSESYEIFDLSVGLSADNWRFAIFGKNITDELYRTVEVNRNVFYNTPRLYGANLTIEW